MLRCYGLTRCAVARLGLQVRAAIRAGEDVDGVDIGRSTALHWAARKGHLGVAAVLVSKGATLMKKTKKGETAIDLAKQENHYEVLDFLTQALDLSRGRRKGSSMKATSRGNTPLKDSSAATAEGQEKMLVWATEIAAEHLAEAEQQRAEATRKQREEEEASNSSANKQAKQKAEIDKLLNALKAARQSISPEKSLTGGGGGDGGAANEGGAAQANPADWQSAVDVLSDIDARSAANASATAAPGATSPARSPTRSPGKTPGRSPAKTPRGSPAKDATAVLAERDARRAAESAEKKKRATEAKAAQERRRKLAAEREERLDAEHKAAERKQRLAKERRLSNAAEKKAKADADRAKRLADLEKARKKSLQRNNSAKKQNLSASAPGPPMMVVSLDGNLNGTPVGSSGSPRKPKGRSRSQSQSESSLERGSGTTPRTKAGSSSTVTPPSRVRTTATNKSTGRTATSKAKTTPTSKAQVRPARSGANSSTSMLSADLEDEYLSWVRGMSSADKEKRSPKAKAKAKSKLGDSPRRGSTREVTIERRSDAGLGVGIYSSKAGQRISVSSVLPQSPFGMAGVEVGDVFLEINGVDVSKATHGEAVRQLKAAPQRFTIKLWSKRADRATTATNVRAPAPTFSPELEEKARSVVVERTSEAEPLGIALISDATDRWVQVHMAMPGGPFDRAGVRANDVILEVNEKPMLALSHQEVVQELKRSGKDIKLRVAALGDVLDTQLAPSDAADTLQSTSFTVTREADQGLGIAICSDKGQTGIRIRNVTPDGPFGKAGVPRSSVFVKIDEVLVLDATHADVVEALRQAKGTFEVTVATDREVEDYVRRRVAGGGAAGPSDGVANGDSGEGAEKFSMSPLTSPTPLKPTKYDIRRTPNQGLGVALCSNKKRLGVRISQLDPKGPLARAGVKELDVIVQVNGFPCLKASHDEVVRAFRRAPTNFAVVVVSGEEFDAVTPEYVRSPTSMPTSPTSPQESYDDMRADAANMVKPSPSRGEIYVEQQSSGADDMRSDRVRAFSDPRVSDALENTEGYLALKKAQEQAMSLKLSTETYEDVFERTPQRYGSLGRRSSSREARGTGIPSPSYESGNPRETVNLSKTIDENILNVMKQELASNGKLDKTPVPGRTVARV